MIQTIDQSNESNKESLTAEATIAGNIAEFDAAARLVRQAGVDDDGNQCYIAPNPRASGASSTDKNYVDNLRATLEDGLLRGRCAIHPCTNPTLPLFRKCNGQWCDNYVHRSCAFKKKSLQFGELGSVDEKVYCRRECKPLHGGRRVGQISTRKPPPQPAAATTPATTTDESCTSTTDTTTIITTKVREERGGKVYGHCSIVGCTYPEQELNRHHCSNCGGDTHNLCAQNNNLCDDDREHLMYCSMICKQTKQK